MGLFDFFNNQKKEPEHKKVSQFRHLLGNDIDRVSHEELDERIEMLMEISKNVQIRPEQLTHKTVMTYLYVFRECVSDVVNAIRKNKDEDINTIKNAARDALYWEINYYNIDFWKNESSLDSGRYMMMLESIKNDVAEKYINHLVK